MILIMETVTLGALAVAVVGTGYHIAKRNINAAQNQQNQNSGGAITDSSIRDVKPGAIAPIGARSEKWSAPLKYAYTIEAAENRHGLPARLLERLLYQESRYREEIISGRVRSPVGAVGIAQFMPATAREWHIDPLNTGQAIDGAARYLAWLKNQLNGWREALAAYNWGIGNVQRRGLIAAPRETSRYVVEIIADVTKATGREIK